MATLQKVDFDPFAPSPVATLVAAKPALQRVDHDPFAAAPLVAKRPQSGAIRRVVGDPTVSFAKGLIGLGESVVGLADIPTGGYAGKALERVGYRPAETKEMIGSLYSPEQKQANQAVADASGFVGTVGAMLKNPSTIAGTVAESMPLMLGGGAVARGLGAVGRLAARPVARAAIGEGAVGAGMAAESLRQQSDDGLLGPRQTAAALGTGVVTGLLGAVGGTVARRLDIGDIDTALAGGAAPTLSRLGLLRRTAAGAVTEGVLEEMPQSAQEQVWQNYANERPLAEGVPEASAMGLLTGAALGGPFAAVSRPRPQPAVDPSGDAAPDTSINVARANELLATPVFADAAPGSLSDAANATPAAQARVAARPRANDSGFRETLAAQATPATAASAQDAPVEMPLREAGQQLADGAAPQTFDIPVLPNVPWINADTGEFSQPSDSEIEGFIHDQFNQQMANGRGINTAVVRKVLASSGLNAKRRNPLITKVQADRKLGITGVTAAADPIQAAASAQPGLDQDRAELDQVTAPAITNQQGEDHAQVGSSELPEIAAANDPALETDAARAARMGWAGSERARAQIHVEGGVPTDAVRSVPNLTYDESPELLDTDVTPPSGGPFSDRKAAELQAKRHDGAKVVEVEGGFAVRKPKAAAEASVSEPQAAAARSPAPSNEAPALASGQTPALETPAEAAPSDLTSPSRGAVPLESANQSTAESASAQSTPAAGPVQAAAAPEADPNQQGFALKAPVIPAAKEGVPPPASLFGAESVRGQIEGTAILKAAARDGKTTTGRTDMAAGEGELFAGERPAQARVPEVMAGATVADIHALAERKRIPWDNDRAFMDFTEAVTGQRHLDALTADQRLALVAALARRPVMKAAAVAKAEPKLSNPTAKLSNPAAPVAPEKTASTPVSADAAPAQGKVIMRGGRPRYATGARETLEAYFKPGRIVKGYAGADRVLGFDWNEGAWSVKVQRVDDQGNPVANEGERRHSTPPESRALVEVLGKPVGKPVGKASLAKAAKKEAAAAVAAPPAPKAQAPEAAPIVDLGEKIGGARKDLSGGREPKKAEAPRYEAVAARDGKSWMVQDAKTKKRVVSPGGYTASLYATEDAATTAATALNQARDKAKASDSTWRKRYAVVDNSTGEIGRKPWAVRDMRTGRMMRGSEAATEEAAEALIPLLVVSQNHRARAMDEGKFEIWRAVTDRKRVKVVKQAFDSRDDAMRYMAEHAAAIIETKTRFGEDVLAKPDQVNRKGPERRTGNVAGQDFMDTFGFRGVEFGNWNNQADRQEVMNHAFDGLLDLADLLGIPPAAISLEGDLALAFGARGQGLTGARAHYEPKRGVINLTKMSGAGALAHEWLHALDHYFGRQDRKKPDRTAGADGTSTFATDAMLSQGSIAASGVRPELLEKYRELVQGMFTKAEQYVEDTARAQKFAGATQEALGGSLQKIRDHLAKNRTFGAKTKAATEEQLAEFDTLADTLLTTPQTFEFKPNKTPAHSKFASGAGRQTNDTLEAMSAILRAVTGRAGFNADKAGDLDMVRGHVKRHGERIAMLESAERQDTKTKRVPTAYVMDAKAIDQGSASDYWTTPQEMAARAFSAYVEDKIAERSDSSDFLSYGSDNRFYVMEGIRPFPEGAERTALAAAFDDFFATVQTKTTERGTALFSKSSEPALQADRAEADAYRDALAKMMTSRRTLVQPARIGRTSAVLQALGAPDLPLTISRDTVRKATNTIKHNVPMSVVEQIPELLADPVAVFASRAEGGGFAVVLQAQDDSGRTVMVALHLSATQESAKVNRIASAYGKDEAGQRFAAWTREGLLRYIADKKNPDLARLMGLQLPASGSPDQGFKTPGTGTLMGLQLPASRSQNRGSERNVLSREDVVNTAGEGGSGLMSKADPQGGGLSFARAQDLKTQLTAKWGDNAPNVVLIQDAEGFPAGARVDPGYRRGEGFYNGSPTVWINVGQIQTEQRFAEVLAHEALGHYGVEKIVGEKQWAGIVGSIERLDREKLGSDQVRRILAEVHQKQPGLSRDNYAREVIAFMAEKGIRNNAVGRVIAAVRRYLRQIMPTIDWSENDVRGLLSAADGFLHRGRPATARARMVQSYAFSTAQDDGAANEIAADDAFVAGLSPSERKSGAIAGLARALWAEMGTDSPFFRDWFGDSKAVDKDGQPLKVYHGTDEEFAAFDPKRAGKSTNHMTARLGLFFDARKDKAEHYARIASNDVPAEQNVLELYLSIRNPYKMTKAEFMEIDGTDVAEQLRERLKSEGYDGIQLPDIGQWIAFDAAQVKSTGNRGTFDRSDNRMLFSKAASAIDVDDIGEIMRDASQHEARMVDRAKAALKNSTPAGLKSLITRIKDVTRETWLGTLPLHYLTQVGEDHIPAMKTYSRLVSEMGADRNQLQQEADEIAAPIRKWAGKFRAAARTLFDLMHDATQLGTDPAEAYQPYKLPKFGNVELDATPANLRKYIAEMRVMFLGRGGDSKVDRLESVKAAKATVHAEARRRKQYPELVKRWNALDPVAQGYYKAMRDLYVDRSKELQKAVAQRIQDLRGEEAESAKPQLMAMQREQFESHRLQGIYFPMQRRGRYYVAAERDDVHPFLMFESLTELERAVAGLEKKGFTIKAHGLKSEMKSKDAPSGSFVADVISKLDKAGVSEKTRDDIYQLYLQALPELSMRKHSVHRKAVPGFDPDALKAFAFNMQHGSHQLARLRKAHKLEEALDVMQEQQDLERIPAAGTKADVRAIAAGDATLEELRKRHEWISNPQDSALVNKLSSLGFVYYLGATPAAALVNLTQTAIISYPYLASRFGPIKAMNVLLAAGRDSARTIGHIDKTLTDPDEILAHKELQTRGDLDKTQALNLAGIAEGGMGAYSPAWAKAMSAISLLFHKAEVINRETTGIAAYRLARADGQSHEQAVEFAGEAITETHGDYSNANRARFIQSGPAKVLLMFRQYSLNVSWHLGRMLWKATKGESPEVKSLARRNLAGVLGMSALFSGAMGLPLMGITMNMLNAIAASFGDDDEPWDAETEFRAFLSDMLGPDAAAMLSYGPISAATGADIASRVSMSQLWFRDADRELDGRGEYNYLLEQAAGPVGGILKNVLVGKQLIDEGHLWRGVETMLPKALKDGFKSIRYASEGVNNLRGDPLIEDVSLYQALLQLSGFTPDQVAKQYDRNRSLKNYEDAVTSRKRRLMDAFAMALRTGDSEGRTDTLAAIQKFNQKWPEIAIDRKAIKQSSSGRARYSAAAEGGIVLNRKIAARIREAVGE